MLSATGDYTFGRGAANFFVDSPDAVAQAILTRLKLWTGEWFLDTDDGTPYSTKILGTGTKPTYDAAVRARILGTEGVASIVSYSSSVQGRALTVAATVNTIFGQTQVAITI